MRKIHHVSALLFVILCQCLRAQSLKCYSCYSETLCKTKMKEKECATFCSAQSYTKGGVRYQKKDCEPERVSISEYQQHCEEFRNMLNKTVEHCYSCNTDFCNTSQQHATIAYRLVVALTAILVFNIYA